MERKAVTRLKARIVELTQKIFVIDEVLKSRGDSRLRSDRSNLLGMLKVNKLILYFLAPATPLEYFSNCTSDFLTWQVLNNSNGTKRMILNGILYRDLVSKAETMTIMEALK